MIKDNPFYILNIPMDASKAVMAAASEAALLRSDGRTADAALAALVNPAKRLEAELDWLPGASAESVSSIRASIRKSRPADTEGLSGIALLNAGLYNFALGDKFRYRGDRFRIYHTEILNIAKAFDGMYGAALLADINRARENAEASPVTLSQLDEALKDKRARMCREIDETLRRMPAAEYRRLFSCLTDSLKEEGNAMVSPVINDLFDRYEINTYAAAEKLADKVRRLAARLVRVGNNAPMFVRLEVYRLNDAALNWERVIRPLEVRAVLQGGIYEPAKELAYELYNETVIRLARYHVNGTADLAEYLIYVFRETPRLSDIFRTVVTRKKELDTERRKTTAAWLCEGIITLALILGGMLLLGLVDKLTGPDPEDPYTPPDTAPTYNESIDPADLDRELEKMRRELEELEENGSLPAVQDEENAEN